MKEGSRDWDLTLEIRSVVGEERVKRNEEAEVGGIEGKEERREDIFHLLLVFLYLSFFLQWIKKVTLSRRLCT